MATVTVTPDQLRLTIANSHDTFVMDDAVQDGAVLTLLPGVTGIKVDAALASRSTFVLPKQTDCHYVPDIHKGELQIKDAQGHVLISLPMEKQENHWITPLITTDKETSAERHRYAMS